MPGFRVLGLTGFMGSLNWGSEDLWLTRTMKSVVQGRPRYESKVRFLKYPESAGV